MIRRHAARAARAALAAVLVASAACGPKPARDVREEGGPTWAVPVRAAAEPLRRCLGPPHPTGRVNEGATWLPVCACAKAAAPALRSLACAAGPNFVAFLAPDSLTLAIAYAPDTAPAVSAGGTEHLVFDRGEVIWVSRLDPAPAAPWYRLGLSPGVD